MALTGKWFPRIGSVYTEYLFASAAQCDTDVVVTLYKNDGALATLTLPEGTDVVAEVSCEGEVITTSDALHLGFSGSTPDLLVVELWGRGNGGGGLIFSEEGGDADPPFTTLTINNGPIGQNMRSTAGWTATYNGSFISTTADITLADWTAPEYKFASIGVYINDVWIGYMITFGPVYDETTSEFVDNHVTLTTEQGFDFSLGDEILFVLESGDSGQTGLSGEGTITFLAQEVEENVDILWSNPS